MGYTPASPSGAECDSKGQRLGTNRLKIPVHEGARFTGANEIRKLILSSRRARQRWRLKSKVVLDANPLLARKHLPGSSCRAYSCSSGDRAYPSRNSYPNLSPIGCNKLKEVRHAPNVVASRRFCRAPALGHEYGPRASSVLDRTPYAGDEYGRSPPVEGPPNPDLWRQRSFQPDRNIFGRSRQQSEIPLGPGSSGKVP